jgi:rRNA maturation endonuclease Nob1
MKLSMIVLLTAAALAVAACGESKEDKAKSQVCDARANIQKQVDTLSGMTLSTATVDGVTNSLKSIQSSLGEIKDAQGDLNGERKQQVQQANQQFANSVKSIAQTVGRSLSLSEAGTQLKDATAQLASSYKQTLGKVDCS